MLQSFIISAALRWLSTGLSTWAGEQNQQTPKRLNAPTCRRGVGQKGGQAAALAVRTGSGLLNASRCTKRVIIWEAQENTALIWLFWSRTERTLKTQLKNSKENYGKARNNDCRLPKINEKSQNGKCEAYTHSGGVLGLFAWPIAWSVKVLCERARLSTEVDGRKRFFCGPLKSQQ